MSAADGDVTSFEATATKSKRKSLRPTTNSPATATAPRRSKRVRTAAPNAVPPQSVLHVPDVFVSTALRFGWFPGIILRDLIQVIGEYFCRFRMYTHIFASCMSSTDCNQRVSLCRTDVCGSGRDGTADGEFDRANFGYPQAVCLSIDRKELICSDHQLRRIDLSSGRVSTVTGAAAAAVFSNPLSLCADPTKVGCYWIGDITSIWYWDGKTVSPIAGGGGEGVGFADGVGSAARFWRVMGLLSTSDARTLYVSDRNNDRLRVIDTQSRAVKTICGDGVSDDCDGIGLNASIRCSGELCFDRSPTTATSGKPESVIWIAAELSIRRFDIETGTGTGTGARSRTHCSVVSVCHFC